MSKKFKLVLFLCAFDLFISNIAYATECDDKLAGEAQVSAHGRKATVTIGQRTISLDAINAESYPDQFFKLIAKELPDGWTFASLHEIEVLPNGVYSFMIEGRGRGHMVVRTGPTPLVMGFYDIKSVIGVWPESTLQVLFYDYKAKKCSLRVASETGVTERVVNYPADQTPVAVGPQYVVTTGWGKLNTYTFDGKIVSSITLAKKDVDESAIQVLSYDSTSGLSMAYDFKKGRTGAGGAIGGAVLGNLILPGVGGVIGGAVTGGLLRRNLQVGTMVIMADLFGHLTTSIVK